jgi:hypothetical protein
MALVHDGDAGMARSWRLLVSRDSDWEESHVLIIGKLPEMM